MKLLDADGNEINVGDSIIRVVSKGSTAIPHVGHRYRVVLYDFNKDGKEDDICADGGFIKELLDETRAKEYRLIS